MEATINEMLSSIKEKFTVYGKIEEGIKITGAKPISEAEKEDISWVSPQAENPEDLIKKSKASVIVCHKDMQILEQYAENRILIQVEDPRLTFGRIVRHYFVETKKSGIDKSAIISEEAEIEEDVFIGANCIIGKCKIRQGSALHGNVTIYDNVTIGKNVTIYAGAVIGSDGFGFFKNEKDEYEHFPHIGGVVIEDNVDIGANTVIDRGSLGNTYIGAGTKIDNLVHIAHNVKVGRNVMIIANAEISGSVTIGDNAWIAPSAAVLDRLTIERDSVIGLGAVVIRDVENGAIMAGNPAKKIK